MMNDRTLGLTCAKMVVQHKYNSMHGLRPADMVSARDAIYRRCNLPGHNATRSQPLRIMLLQHGRSSVKKKMRRHIKNFPDLVRMLNMSSADIKEQDMHGKEPCEQVRAFRDADVVVGSHGAALSNLVFMRPHTTVVEVTGEHKYNFFWPVKIFAEKKFGTRGSNHFAHGVLTCAAWCSFSCCQEMGVVRQQQKGKGK